MLRLPRLPAALVLALVSAATLAPGHPATLTYRSPDAGQQLLLRRDGERLVLVNQQSHAIVASASARTTERVVIRGADDRDDTLTLDLTSPFSVPRGIDYDGGARGWDTLVVSGGSVQKETVTQLTPHDGIFDLDGLVLRYTNLEPTTDTTAAASVTVLGTPGTDFVTISDGTNPGEATISSATFESYTFANKTNVVFDGLGGDDSVMLSNPATPTGLASFIIQNVATVEQTDTFSYPAFGVSATGMVNLPLGNNAANVEMTTQTGDITYRDADSVTIGGVSAGLSGLRVTDEGSIVLQAGGSITLADTDGAEIIRSGATAGNVVLEAGSDIQVVVNNKAIISPAGLVSATSGGDILLGTAGSSFDNDVQASSDVTLDAQRDIVISGNAEVFSDAFGNGTGGTATGNAVRDFLLSDATAGNARFGSTGFGGGIAQVFAPGSVVLTAPDAAALVSTSGLVTVFTGRLIIGATSGISAPAQTVSITSASGELDFGSTTDAGVALELSDAEADRITTPSLIVEGSGSLTVTQPITFAGELTVRSGSLFGATGAGSLSAPTLRFQDLAGAPRTWTINGTGVTIAPGSVIPYSGVSSLFADGGFGDDTFDVTPAVSTTITIAGRLPDLPTSPGDTLNVDTSGTTSPFLTSTQTETGFTGTYTFGNRAPVNFSDIETFSAATDLAITKTDGAASETPGTPVTYTIVASNAGALGMGGATVTDALPAVITGVTWTCAASPGSTCPSNGSGDFNVPVSLAAGGTATFTVTGTINAAATGTLSNTATIDVPGGTSDTNPANNSATDTDTLLVLTTLTTTASAGVLLGGQVHDTAVLADGASPTGTITFRLFGPNDASCSGAVAFMNSVPVSGNGSYDSANFTPLQAGTYRWIASYSGDVANAASAGACNYPNESVTVNDDADVAVTKTGPAPVVAGSNISYTITAANNGPAAAQNVTITDVLPPGTAFVSATPTQGSCAGTTTVTCTLGTIANGASATVTLIVSTTGATSPSISNTATVTATNPDPVPGNNSSTATTTVTPSADLAVTKTGPATVVAGTNVSYTITVTNNGPSPAQNVSVTDTLPGGTTFVSATPSQGSCSGTSTVTCALGTINNGAGATVTLVVSTTGATPGAISNTASVSTTTSDPAPGNNAATAGTTVTPSADVAVTKTGPATVVAGGNVSYTIMVTNNGPSAAQSVTVSDPIPIGTALVSATPTQGSCSGTSTVTCALGTMNNGASATVTLVVSTTGTTPSPISNTASVSTTTSDPAPANNSSTAVTTVIGSADVALTKTGPSTIAAGDHISYTITVTNNGPSAAQGVTVSDPIPSGTAFVSATPTQGSCAGTSTVTCSLGTIANGGSATVTLVVSTSAATPGSISNTASVSAATNDPAPGNNSATAIVTNLGCSAMTATPAVLPPAIAGDPYSQTFATNGAPPVTLTLTGTLPAGLSFAGAVLSGVPTQRGAFPVTLHATDANGCQGSFPYTVAVSRERSLAVGAGEGGGSGVKTFGVHSFTPRLDLNIYNPPFTGGVSVAQGDTNGDGVADVITGAGPGGAPLVRIFDGVTGGDRLSFFAYDPALPSGIEVAAGDVNGDGIADIITVPGYGGPPIVRVFDGRTGVLFREFLGMTPTWTFGLHVGAGDVNGDGLADIIVGSGPAGPPLVQVFDGFSGAVLRQFLAYQPEVTGGVYVAGGDVTGDGFADIVTGAGSGGGPHVRVFDGLTGGQIAGPLGSFFAYAPTFTGGVRVGAGDFDGDGFAEVITGAGPGGGPHVRVWDGATWNETFGVFAFDPSFSSGVFVAGPPASGHMAIDLLQSTGPASVRIAGWALQERSTRSPGTDAVHAWAYPVAGGSPVFVGAAPARGARPDVAAAFGGEFLMSGFDFSGPLVPGTYDVVVFVRNDKTFVFDQRRFVRITVP